MGKVKKLILDSMNEDFTAKDNNSLKKFKEGNIKPRWNVSII